MKIIDKIKNKFHLTKNIVDLSASIRNAAVLEGVSVTGKQAQAMAIHIIADINAGAI